MSRRAPHQRSSVDYSQFSPSYQQTNDGCSCQTGNSLSCIHSQQSPLYSNPDPKPLISPVGLSLAATGGGGVVEPGRAPVGLVDGDETGCGHALAQL